MEEKVGSKTVYFITQKDRESGREDFVIYNEYNGSFSTHQASNEATRFNLKEQAVDLARLQNQMSELLKQKFEYRVIEEVVTRTEVSLVEQEEIIEPEPEDNPEVTE